MSILLHEIFGSQLPTWQRPSQRYLLVKVPFLLLQLIGHLAQNLKKDLIMKHNFIATLALFSMPIILAMENDLAPAPSSSSGQEETKTPATMSLNSPQKPPDYIDRCASILTIFDEETLKKLCTTSSQDADLKEAAIKALENKSSTLEQENEGSHTSWTIAEEKSPNQTDLEEILKKAVISENDADSDLAEPVSIVLHTPSHAEEEEASATAAFADGTGESLRAGSSPLSSLEHQSKCKIRKSIFPLVKEWLTRATKQKIETCRLNGENSNKLLLILQTHPNELTDEDLDNVEQIIVHAQSTMNRYRAIASHKIVKAQDLNIAQIKTQLQVARNNLEGGNRILLQNQKAAESPSAPSPSQKPSITNSPTQAVIQPRTATSPIPTEQTQGSNADHHEDQSRVEMPASESKDSRTAEETFTQRQPPPHRQEQHAESHTLPAIKKGHPNKRTVNSMVIPHVELMFVNGVWQRLIALMVPGKYNVSLRVRHITAKRNKVPIHIHDNIATFVNGQRYVERCTLFKSFINGLIIAPFAYCLLRPIIARQGIQHACLATSIAAITGAGILSYAINKLGEGLKWNSEWQEARRQLESRTVNGSINMKTNT